MAMGSALDIVAAHLNAASGPIVRPGDVASALRSGSLLAVEAAPEALALLEGLFLEVDPALIARCLAEAGADLQHAQALYEETVLRSKRHVPAWERAVKDLL